MVGTVKVVFCKNPFDSTDRVIEERDSTLSFREIYTSFLPHYDIEYAQIIDTDVIVEDYDSIPETDEVYIRIFPSGGSPKNIGLAQGIIGAALVIGGILVSIGTLGGGTPLGVAMIGAGVGMMLSGYVMYNTDIPSDLGNSQTTKQSASIRGAKNQSRPGARIPILLGKHLIVPDTCGLPFITNGYELKADGSRYITPQYAHQLFCCGYKDIVLDMSTIKVGETPFTSKYFDMDVDVLRGVTTLSDLYPSLVRQTVISGLMEYGNPIIKTTPTNTKEFAVDISFPNGLLKYDKDGDAKSYSVDIKVEYREHTSDDSAAWKAVMPLFSKYGEDYFTISGKYFETYRQTITKTLDNIDDTGDDYCPSRQYDIRVRRLSENNTKTKYIDKVYWDMMKSYIADFSDAPTLNTRPITEEMQSNLTLIAAKIKAGDNANNIIDNLNVVGQLETYVWDGTGSGASHWSAKALTSNPAACFLYVIRSAYIAKKPATDDQIDWAAFEAWYSFCSLHSFECNNHMNFNISLEEVLDFIVLTARASWFIRDGKYTIIVEKAQSVPVQFFTPRNSSNFGGTKVFADLPTGLTMKYVDASAGYMSVERTVYYDEDDPYKDDRLQDVTLWGVTSADHAYKIAKYQLACSYLRPEVFSFKVDVEYLVCSKGDRIKVNHDVPLFGLFAGRVVRIDESLGLAQCVRLDEAVIFEPGKIYGLTIRLQTGEELNKRLINPAVTVNIETQEVYFYAAFARPTGFEKDTLAMFGEFTHETMDLLIIGISVDDDFSANITAVEYNEAVYNADSGDIPPYVPRIDMPGDAETAVIIGSSADPAVTGAENTQMIGETDLSETALAINTASSKKILANGKAIFPHILSGESIIYTHIDAMELYIKSTNDETEGTSQLINGRVWCDDYFVDLNGILYNFNEEQITDIEVYSPVLTIFPLIAFVNPADMCVYGVNPTETLPVTSSKLSSYSLLNPNICYIENGELVLIDADGSISESGNAGLIVVNAVDCSYKRTIFEHDIVQSITELRHYGDGFILFISADDLCMYKCGSGENGSFWKFNINTLYMDTKDKLTSFIHSVNNGLYIQSATLSEAVSEYRPVLRKSSAPITISGTIALDSEIMTAVPTSDILKIEVGDLLQHANLKDDTTVISIIDDTIVLSKTADASGTFVFTLVGGRVFFDAKDILLSESITEDELSASAYLEMLKRNHPVGTWYTQYPSAKSNDEAVAFPGSEEPANKFGGVWTEPFAGEYTFFRTTGVDGQTRVNGFSEDQTQKLTGTILAMVSTTPSDSGVGALRLSAQVNNRATYSTIGAGSYSVSFDSANSPNAKVSTSTTGFTEVRNYLIKVWYRES